MPVPIRIPLGAPGIYQHPDAPLRALSGVQMDVSAFVGIATRGPVRVPVVNEKWPDDRPCVEPERPRRRTVAIAVESFDEYRRLYGGFEGPGLLPYAVASFFEQGGRRAYVARIVHEYDDAMKNAGGVASGEVPEAESGAMLFKLLARNEGGWGNRLRARLEFTTLPILFNPIKTTLARLFLDEEQELALGTLLRLTLQTGQRVLRFVAALTREQEQSGIGFYMNALLDLPVVDKIEAAEVVEGILLVDDGDGRVERHERLGLSAAHPRWLATVLCYESQLVYPDASWSNGSVSLSQPNLLPGPWSEPFEEGLDRWVEIEPADFIEAQLTIDDEEPGDGVHALAQLSDLSLVVVPDLYSPAPIAPREDIIDPVSLAGPDFDRCFVLPSPIEQAQAQFDLEGLRLDPKLPGDRDEIIKLQQQLVDYAEDLRSFVVLLDVPPGLNQRQILSWRTHFNSSYAAAYHPWLQIARRDDQRDALIHLPPSAAAAGIIARQELAFGVPHGPANTLAAQVIGLDDRVSPSRHDELHPQGINVYLRERDGIRLTAARTLTRDPQWRQLSVRRLITMIIRALQQQMQWVVFEPHTAALRAEVRHALRSYLRQLFRLGAFRGATEEEAFFVRCDETNNPNYIIDAGRLITEIGVAPAEPLEFIVLRLAREGDGTLILQEK